MVWNNKRIRKKGLEFDSFYYFNFFKDALRIYHIPLDPYMFSWYSKLLQKDDYTKKKNNKTGNEFRFNLFSRRSKNIKTWEKEIK